MEEIPKKYKHLEVEAAWVQRWEERGTYKWDESASREDTFVVDTPPPTVSGSLHIGHCFSYTHQDLLARYQRMNGKNIFYPMGFDDNGLPTERRVQNVLAIRCDPYLPYDPDWKPNKEKTQKQRKRAENVSRRNFIEACGVITVEDEAVFEDLWHRLGLSIDWSQKYATIDENSRAVSQASFLDLVEKGHVYNVKAPTMWDVDFQTAVAQAEVEDRPQNGNFYDIRFAVEGGGEFVIATTRPELLPACIAVVAHPDDERYQGLFGKMAITPLFKAPVPILPAEHADPEKGTGILMVCTFGDSNDVDWWKQSGLPVKQVIGTKGTLIPVTFGEDDFESQDVAAAQAAYEEIQGLSTKKAKKRIAELLGEDGSAVGGEGSALVGDPRPVEQSVKFYEKGDRPLEFVATRQWFIRILEHKEALLAQGNKIQWHPEHFKVRLDHWIEGLNQDWCISRQRFFGVSFPVWYPLDETGEPNRDEPIFASADTLPIDPLSDVPPGFEAAQRGQPGGFIGEPDVMDTWATSSMSPQIMSQWATDGERHKKLFPMDLRPQSHEIIRTWAFYTIVKAWMHEGEIPWHNVVISGWVLDPDRKKMSKSKGNVVTPGKLLDSYSADAVRYWASRARPGVDTINDEAVFKVGKRLATKLFNASRFVIGQIERVDGGFEPKMSDITEGLDKALIMELRQRVKNATAAFERFDYAAVLHSVEDSFWSFCDNYLELVKVRSYSDDDTQGRRSAVATLCFALRVYLRLFAPFLPYVSEEVWSWRFAGEGRLASVHSSPWPSVEEMSGVQPLAVDGAYGLAAGILGEIRASKSKARRSLKWEISHLRVAVNAEDKAALALVIPDVLKGGNVTGSHDVVDMSAGDDEGRFKVEVTLAPEPEPKPEAS